MARPSCENVRLFRFLYRVASWRMSSWEGREHSIEHQIGAWNVGIQQCQLNDRDLDNDNNTDNYNGTPSAAKK